VILKENVDPEIWPAASAVHEIDGGSESVIARLPKVYQVFQKLATLLLKLRL